MVHAEMLLRADIALVDGGEGLQWPMAVADVN
jgi:hypothetical protein